MKKAIHLPTYIVPILHFSTLKASIDLRLHIYVFFFPLGMYRLLRCARSAMVVYFHCVQQVCNKYPGFFCFFDSFLTYEWELLFLFVKFT